MPELFTFTEESMRRVAREVFASERTARSWIGVESGAAFGGGAVAPALPKTMRFRNDAEEEIPAFAVMRVTGIETTGGRATATVAKPSSTFQRLYLVNGAVKVASGKFGEGSWLSEANYVLYNASSGTPAYGESWGPKNGQWSLEEYRYGFTILGGNTGSDDTARTGAIQHQVNGFIGKTDSSHAKGATGTISIYDGNEVDTTDNMTGVDNLFATVASGKWVDVEWRGGRWYLTSAECA
jgi:hypothetical protein